MVPTVPVAASASESRTADARRLVIVCSCLHMFDRLNWKLLHWQCSLPCQRDTMHTLAHFAAVTRANEARYSCSDVSTMVMNIPTG